MIIAKPKRFDCVKFGSDSLLNYDTLVVEGNCYQGFPSWDKVPKGKLGDVTTPPYDACFKMKVNDVFTERLGENLCDDLTKKILQRSPGAETPNWRELKTLTLGAYIDKIKEFLDKIPPNELPAIRKLSTEETTNRVLELMDYSISRFFDPDVWDQLTVSNMQTLNNNDSDLTKGFWKENLLKKVSDNGLQKRLKELLKYKEKIKNQPPTITTTQKGPIPNTTNILTTSSVVPEAQTTTQADEEEVSLYTKGSRKNISRWNIFDRINRWWFRMVCNKVKNGWWVSKKIFSGYDQQLYGKDYKDCKECYNLFCKRDWDTGERTR